MSDVDRRSGLTMESFYEEYVKPNKPVILTDAADNWSALSKFTPEFFNTNFPDKRATIKGKEYSLSEYIDIMNTTTVDAPGPYPFKVELTQKFQEVFPDVSPGFEILRKNRLDSPFFTDRIIPLASTLELFFGGPGGWFPYIHYDLYGMYAIVTQVYGSKQFTLWAPDQAKYLYVSKEDPWMSSIENYYEKDFERYPEFEKAVSSTVTVNPGETIFVPLGYWHTARSMEATISIAQDLVSSYNWHVLRRDAVFYKKKVSKIKGELLDLYIRLVGAAMSVHEKMIKSY